jgi:uncharacterized protein involved in exopolysaccharide biosynthesis
MSEAGPVNLLGAIWRHRYVVLLTGLAAAACTAGASYRVVPIYKAAVVMTLVQDQDAAKRLQAASNTITAVASLTGLDPMGYLTGNARMQQFMRSRELVEAFIARYELVPVLFPHSTHPVSVWFAAKRFRERVLYVYEDRAKGTTSLFIEWPDPRVAADWANKYVALANEMVRKQDLQTAQHRIVYLRQQAAGTTDVGVQGYLYQRIASEVETSMLASGQNEYAFTVVDRATAPELRTRPARTVMTLLGAATGLFGAAVAVFACYAVPVRLPWLPVRIPRHAE